MANPAKDARDRVLIAFPDATMVERKRTSIKHSIPSQPGKFVLDASIGPMHFGSLEDQEIDTAWQPGVAPWNFQMLQAGYNAFALSNFASGQIVKYVDPISGESIAFQPQQLQYTNDLDQIQAIADPQAVAATIANEDTLLWTGAYGLGFDLRWQCQTARFDKRLRVDQASRFPAPTATIISGGNPVLRLQFIFAPSNGIDIYLNGQLWTRGPNSRVDTQGYMEFRSQATGLVLWTFNLPRTFKSDTAELLGTFRMRRSGNSLFVEHRIPLIELRAATYPVEIDVTIDAQIAVGANDGVRRPSPSYFSSSDTNNATGRTSTTVLHQFFRWTGISLEGTIDVAYMQIYAFAAATGTPELTAYGIDEDNPAAPTTGTEFDADPLTTASVNWDGAWTSGIFNQSPSITAVFQELVDTFAISSEAVMVQIRNRAASGDHLNETQMYDGSASNAAKLHIEYTAAGGGHPATRRWGGSISPTGAQKIGRGW